MRNTRKRLKVTRAINSNEGTIKALSRELQRLNRQARKMIIADIWQDLEHGGLTQDAKPTLEGILNATKSGADRVYRFVSTRFATWLDKIIKMGKRIAEKFFKRLCRDTTSAQKKEFIKLGIPEHLIKKSWTVKQVGQYIAPEAAKTLPKQIEGFIDLITKTTAQDVEKIQNTFAQGFESGWDTKRIRESLEQLPRFDPKRAEWVARDQSNKITAAIQIENAKAVGMTKAVWVHVPGMYTSRETHKAMDGKEFDISKGLYDSDVKKFVLPGECIYCRCRQRFVLPEE